MKTHNLDFQIHIINLNLKVKNINIVNVSLRAHIYMQKESLVKYSNSTYYESLVKYNITFSGACTKYEDNILLERSMSFGDT